MVNEEKKNNILSELYHSLKSPVSYSSPYKLYKAVRVRLPNLRLKDVKEWLMKDLTYTLHHPIRTHYNTRRVLVHEIDEQWQADLCDMQKLSKQNRGYKHLLVCIDILSKFAWVRPLKSKSGQDILNALSDIFSKGRKPKILQTDRGTEFLNAKVQKLLKDEGVKFFTSFSERKASVVERFNRTLKGNPVVYKVKDQANEPIEGIFYQQELQRVYEPDSYKIEKIIKKQRQPNGSWKYLVKWKGYPEKFNSFVNETDLKSLKK
ncbi:SCAN domain-containing protein 3-like [Clytia hemisphaerica]|uniref:SCAN domain-containing protein 3-like n=1 Tax=Clytia hemisphaerica TaxID=252671 RepID=UPI0034D57DC6